jgi:hypothetical protein
VNHKGGTGHHQALLKFLSPYKIRYLFKNALDGTGSVLLKAMKRGLNQALLLSLIQWRSSGLTRTTESKNCIFSAWPSPPQLGCRRKLDEPVWSGSGDATRDSRAPPRRIWAQLRRICHNSGRTTLKKLSFG